MKNTRKSLVLSVLSMLLCVAMLLGTTFAWFTDSVTSGTNKIVAGNLDIEVQYKNDNTNGYKNLAGSTTVFSKGLWEPGHTEFVTLKIENNGTLALKYAMNVSPISEMGGINVNGESFKLSDYLFFGSTDATTTEPVYANREAARADATTQKLNQAGLTKENTILAGGAAQYITLVVYMPESVGNEANYKTGTTAPEIDLGITVLATQIDSETDSFGKDYDKDAFGEMDTTISYNYFPQVTMVGQVKVTDSANVDKGTDAGNEVGVNSNKVTVYSDSNANHSGTIASVTVPVQPKSGAVAGDVGTVKLEVKKMDAPSAGITVSADKEATSYDIKTTIDGKIEKTTDGLYIVNINIGAGKSDLSVTHVHNSTNTVMTKVNNASAVDANNEYYYDINTGVLTMAVTEFSEFATVYNKATAAIGTTAYGSLADAIKGAKAGETIVLLKDETYTASSFIFNGINLNLNGHKITVTRTADSGRNFDLFGNVTFANGSIVAELPKDSNCAIYANKSSNVVLNNVNVKAYQTGTNKPAYAIAPFGGYMDDPNGNLIINGGVFDGSVATNGSTRGGSVTINSGTFNEVVYFPAYSTYTINGGTFNKAVEFRSGIINISGGTFNNVGTPKIVMDGNEIDSIDGCSIGLISYNGPIDNSKDSGYGPNPELNITGGTFAGKIGLARDKYSYSYPIVNKNGVKVDTVELGKVATWADLAATNFTTAVDTTNKIVTINSAEELALFAKTASNYAGYTVNLTADVDLQNKPWSPINISGETVFNGNNHTVSNLSVSGEKKVGLFGATSCSTIKNLTVDGATVSGINHVAAITGYAICASIENCHVKNATITTSVKNNDDGDKAGAIAGYFTCEPGGHVSGCTATNCTVTGYRDIGALVGYVGCYTNSTTDTAYVTGNTVKDCKAYCDKSNDYNDYGSGELSTAYDVNEVIGDVTDDGDVAGHMGISNNTIDNTTASFKA